MVSASVDPDMYILEYKWSIKPGGGVLNEFYKIVCAPLSRQHGFYFTFFSLYFYRIVRVFAGFTIFYECVFYQRLLIIINYKDYNERTACYFISYLAILKLNNFYQASVLSSE